MDPSSEAVSIVAVLLTTVTMVCCSPLSDSAEASYSGFRVLRLESDDPAALTNALQMLQHSSQMDVWSRLQRSADVMVAPDRLRSLREVSATLGVGSSVVIDDVQRYLDAEYAFRQHRRLRRAAQRNITNSYLTYQEIENYLYNDVAQRYSANSAITVKAIGKTFEGRNVHVVELRQKGSLGRKPAILIDAGIHAREWIAPALALNIINKLAFNPDNDPDVNDLLAKFDWFVVPSINPDGYVYSQTGSTTRLWRKTRTTKYYTTAYGPCRGIGVDGNRNFGYDWNPKIGGSTCASSDVFAGPAPFSELETQNIRDWILSHAGLAKAYITIHAFGQYLLYPYGSDMNKAMLNEELNIDVANAFKDRLGQLGVTYVVGNSARELYSAAGGSDDYAKGAANVSVSYTLELPPISPTPGFLLPEPEIAQVIKNTWAGLKVLAQRLYSRLEQAVPVNPIAAGSTALNAPFLSSLQTVCDWRTDTILPWVQQYLRYYCATQGGPSPVISGR